MAEDYSTVPYDPNSPENSFTPIQQIGATASLPVINTTIPGPISLSTFTPGASLQSMFSGLFSKQGIPFLLAAGVAALVWVATQD
jgi:hypothetical protein